MKLPIANNKGIKFSGKTCACCGKFCDKIPDGAPLKMGLYWFNCTCESTICVKEGEVE